MTDETKIIRGSGGGPKPPPPPYRAPDTLHSRSFATVQDLISEGEIEGFASASKEGLTKGTTAYENASLKDVFLDDTPILQSNASSASPNEAHFNFRDVTFKSKFGEGNQTAMSGIPNADESRTPTGVGVEVQNDDLATVWTTIKTTTQNSDGSTTTTETGKNYTVNQIVVSSSSDADEGIVFKCTTAGQAGTTEPTAFITATVGQTITDNAVTWTAQSSGLSGSVTRQITNTDVDAVIVTLTWPQIQILSSNGDIYGDTVKYKIELQYQSGGYVSPAAVQTFVTGRTADAYARDHRINLDRNRINAGTAFPVDVRVSRISADSTTGQRQNLFQFTSIQEVVDNNSTYNNSAYVALRLDSKQFNRVPTRKYRIRGIKVKIPGAGANVVSANYTQNDGATSPAAGKIITVTNNNHGLFVGESVAFTATSGNGGTGTFVIQTVSTDGNSFTLTSANTLNITTSTCTYTVIPRVDIQTGRIIYPDGYIFNGVMGAAVYTNCPAMCLLDLLTNKRYGLGDHVTESNLDLFSFVAASKYANEGVDDGTGSGAKEARFSCNVNIQSPKEAFAAINELSGVMRCMPIWSAGSITISQDKPTTASYLFNLANVGETGFNYQGSSLKRRNSVVSVSYFNMDSKEVDFEVVEDAEAIAKVGTIVKKVKAFACTSRNQAARLGRAILFAEQHECETVTFTTSIDSGVVVRPGSVIEIADPVRAGVRRGGRVVSATNTTINIDALAQTNLPALNDAPTISVILPDGTVEVGSISSMVGAVITVNSVQKINDQGAKVTQSTFSKIPAANSPYLISSTNLQTQLFRVIQVEEQDEVNYTISALAYVEGKYAFIENGTALPERKVSLLNEPVASPSNLSVTEKTVVINNVARSKLIISWQAVKGVNQYQVNYRLENGNYVTQVVFSNQLELLDTQEGTYEIQVFSYNLALTLSANPTTTTFAAKGKTELPENISGLSIESINENLVRLKFNQARALDVLHGGRVYIRHTNQTGSSAKFQSAQDVIEAVAGNATEAIVPALPGTYLLKFQDDGNRFSADPATVELSLVDILESIVVKTDREDNDTPPFNNGTSSLFNNTLYDTEKGGLILTDPSAVATGTYSQTNSRTIICTINSHGFSVGEKIQFTFTTHTTDAGSQPGLSFDSKLSDGEFTVSGVTNTNVFTVLATEPDTNSGNLSVKKGFRGTYNFATTLDLGGVFSINLKRHFQGAGYYPSALFDDRTGLVNDWPDWDGDAAESTNASLAVRTSTDMSAYTDFNVFTNGTFKGRGFQFQARLETSDPAQNMLLQQLGYTATMPLRTEQSSKITSGEGAKTVPFAAPFFVGTSSITGIPKPSVTISPQNMATGDYYELNDSNISGTQFIVHFKDSSGANISRDFTYTAVGFGKGG